MGAVSRSVGIGAELDVGGDELWGNARVDQVLVDGLLADPWIVDGEVGAFVEEIAADVDGRGFAGVVGVLFEGKTEDANALAVDRIIKGADDFFDEAGLLPIVELHDLGPVLGHFRKIKGIAKVNKVEDVLLEAGTAEADGGFEELRADPRIHADGAGDFVDVGTRGFAKRGDGVDRGDPLGEEGVGDEFGQLRGPEIGGEDALAGDPAGVNRGERFDGCCAFESDFTADEDAVGELEVFDGSAFGEKLGVGEDLEGSAVRGVGSEDRLDCRRRFYGDGALLNDDLVAFGNFRDQTSSGLDVAKIRRTSCADAVRFGRCADGDEDQIRCSDGTADVGREVKVSAESRGNDGIETRFVNRERVRVPRSDPLFVHVRDRDLDVRALGGDHGHGRAADVAGAEAADGFDSHGNVC